VDNKQVFDNPPLVEVILEIKWNLQEVVGILGVSIDPFFGYFSKKFSSFAVENKFGYVEPLIPEGAPVEFFAGKPAVRFRKGENQWPLFQIGQGLLTVNDIPPYKGWDKFYEDSVKLAIEGLYDSYPNPQDFLKIETLSLRYINAFDDVFGYETFKSFVEDNLGINFSLREGLVLGKNLRFNTQTVFDLEEQNTTGLIKVNPGKKYEKDALILELGIQKTFESTFIEKGVALEWFNGAHNNIERWFNGIIINDDLKEKFKLKQG
jgi:uncharacterized protein (TIGR04255 family)